MSESSRIGFGPRLGAYLLDLVLAIILGLVIGMVAGASIAGLVGDLGGMAGMLGGAVATVAGVFLVYIAFLLMEAFMGASPGKMILSLRIKNDDGTNAGVGALLLRAVLKNISYVANILTAVTGIALIYTIGSLGALVIFIGCFFVLGSQKKSIHDMIAKTAVYKK